MSTTNTVLTNYSGKVAQGYLTRALKSGDTIGQGLVSFKTGLKEKGITLRRIEVDNLIKDATCEFDPTGDVRLDFKRLTGKKLEVNLEICKDDFEGAWEAEDMGDSAHDDVPKEYIAALLKYIAGKIAEANDRLMWRGVAGPGAYDGILTKLAADTDLPAGNKITGTTVTKANVADEIDKVVEAIPDAVYNLDSDLVIAIASNVGRAYMRALAGFGSNGEGGAGYQNMGFVGRKPLDYGGIPMFMVGGLPSNTMVAYKIENMAFGTGVIADWTKIKVLDMSDVTGDDTFRIIMKFYAGVEYGFPEEIVVYGLNNVPAES